MIGLIRKDFYTLRKNLFIIALLAVFYAALGLRMEDMGFLAGFLVVIAMTISTNLFYMDESCHFDAYAVRSPLSRAQIVLARYLSAGLLALIGAVCGFASLLLPALISGRRPEPLEWIVLAVISVCGLVLLALLLPLLYRFGAERGRYISFLLLLLPLGVVLLLGDRLPDTPAAPGGPVVQALPLLLAAASVLIIALSLLVSIRIYRKKEF